MEESNNKIQTMPIENNKMNDTKPQKREPGNYEKTPLFNEAIEANDANEYSVGKSQIPTENISLDNGRGDIVLPSSREYDTDTESDSASESESDSESYQKNGESYKYKGATFTVSVSEYLQKDMQVLHPEKEYTVHLCLYKVVLDSLVPYLTYYLTKKENLKLKMATVQFPNYKFQLSDIRNPLSPRTVRKITGGADNSHKFEAEFMEEVYQHVYSFCEDPQQIPSLEPFYRGFYVNEDAETPDIYVVVDMTQLTVNAADLIRALPYELLITKTCMEIPVHPSVTELFQMMKTESGTLDFHQIKREDGTYVESPYCLYICDSSTIGGYENVATFNKTSKNGDTNDVKAQIVYPRVYYDKLGMSILMTTHAFDTDNAEQMQRYAVFAEKAHTLYIEADSDAELQDIYTDNAAEYNVIAFIDKSANRQFWSLTTPFILDEI